MAAADTTIATAATAARGKAAVTASNSLPPRYALIAPAPASARTALRHGSRLAVMTAATRGTAMPGHGVGSRGHPHRGEHDETHEHGVESSGRRSVHTHDGGDERGDRPTSRRAAPARSGAWPRRG